MANNSKSAEAIEGYLVHMLDFLMMWELAYRSNELLPVGILNNWRMLRERLLSPVPFKGDENYLLPEIPQGWELGKKSAQSAVSALEDLHTWLHTSAKIYALSDEQQREWLKADYSTLRWCDLQFPQSNFFIELPQPVMAGEYQTPCSVILVALSSVGDRHGIKLRFFETRDVYAEFLRQHRRQVLADMERGRVQQAKQLVEQITGGRAKVSPAHNFFNLEIDLKAYLVTEPADLFTEVQGLSKSQQIPLHGSSAWQHLSTALKSVVGFVRALERTPPAERSERRLSREMKDVAGRYVLSPVTEGLNFCQLIGTAYKYLDDRRGAGRRDIPTGKEQDPQNRDGYYRREHGEGNNPDAPRRWIDSYTTRKDKIAQGILPKPKRVIVRRG